VIRALFKFWRRRGSLERPRKSKPVGSVTARLKRKRCPDGAHKAAIFGGDIAGCPVESTPGLGRAVEN
jgi:hypothetical protein